MKKLKTKRKNYIVYGIDQIEEGAISQMDSAMQLPVSVAGALMPDAHQGYGLPIGGVLATDNVVMPYGVGVDIGCRMCMSIYDLPESFINKNKSRIKMILKESTRFGRAEFNPPRDHEILHRKEFTEIKILKELQQKAYQQIGTSGHGNHFIDAGIIEIYDIEQGHDITAGKYFALLSHSGSRNLGARIADHYTKKARMICGLPKGSKNLAWLGMDSEEGEEYWKAMTVAGDYSAANHEQIHDRLADALGDKPVTIIQNIHNFAWKEKISNNMDVIIHRKGATPAKKGDLGIIPGSMASPAFIVRGKGDHDSLNSASHGAGRVMSRGEAKRRLNKKDLKKLLDKKGVELIGAGIDESPQAYKNINRVMEYQKDLVEVLGEFTPRIVRMCGEDSH